MNMFLSRHASQKGFNLIEILIANLILVVGIIGAMKMFGTMFKSIDVDRERVAMTNLALNRLEEWRSYSYAELIPYMPFTYFTRIIDRNTGAITFSQQTETIGCDSKIDMLPSGSSYASGYSSSFTLPSGANMMGGTDTTNNVWYDGPDATPSNNTPGAVNLVLSCPRGVTGILTIIVNDYNSQQREEKIYVNGIVVRRFAAGTFSAAVSIDQRTVSYTLTQADTATGQINIEVRQTSDANLPTYGGLNPNAVLSKARFDVLEGFQEHDSAPPYNIESKIMSTYDDIRLVPGWQITVIVTKSDKYKPVELSTTISR